MNSSLTNHDSYPYSRQNYGRVKDKLPLWSWPERSTAHVRHNISTALNQNVWRWITATSFPFHHLDFPPISDFVTAVRINIELLRYARLPLVHWHGLQAGERYRLYKVNALYNSLGARTQILPVELFCNQLIGPRFQQRRALLLVNTKHSTSARLFDWLTHIIKMPFLDSSWSLVYSMCHCSLLSCKAKQSKLTMKLTYAHRTYRITALKTPPLSFWGAIKQITVEYK